MRTREGLGRGPVSYGEHALEAYRALPMLLRLRLHAGMLPFSNRTFWCHTQVQYNLNNDAYLLWKRRIDLVIY
eukprot:4792347-Prymnesium_polylepis.2